jgi:predicted GIY-YIG superfamily endonuclease
MKDLIRRILREQYLSKTGIEYKEMKKFVRDKRIHNTKYFEDNFPSEYNFALKNDWLLKLATELNFDDLGDINNRKIYIFLWEKPIKRVYVGLTLDPNTRYKQHLKNLVTKNPDPDKFYVLTSKFISKEKAQKKEAEILCKFKEKGWEPLNKYYSKSLGACTKDITPFKDLIKRATDGSVEDIKDEDPELYRLIKTGKLNKIGAIKRKTNIEDFENTPIEPSKMVGDRKLEKKSNFINIETGEVYSSLRDVTKRLGIDPSTLFYNIKNKGNYKEIIYPYKYESKIDNEFDDDFIDNDITIDDLYETKNIIKKVLKEESSKLNLLKLIQNEDIFSAAELVGGIDNLKKIFKEFPDITDMIDSLKGELDLTYHSRKQYIEFPMKFEIVGKGVNIWDTNSWPIVNLIYDDSMLTDSEKEIFDSFVFDSINDLNIGNVDMKPEARKMFREKGGYIGIKYVNGKHYKTLENEVPYEDKDISQLNGKYKLYNALNESNIIKENEDNPTQKILNFLLRRYKIDEVDLGWTDNPIKLKMIKFDIDGERYSISTFENKRQQIAKILDMLTIHNVIDNIDSNEGKLDPYTQKVVRAVKQFINQVM